MQRIPLLDGWSYTPVSGMEAFFRPGVAPVPVTLPHDAMVLAGRDAQARPGGLVGWYPAGTHTYTRMLDVPADWEKGAVALEFEGVYANAMVYVNGRWAGQRPYGYSEFTVDLRPHLKYGAQNEIRVVARTSSDGDARWYSGAGLYRPVNLLVADRMHIGANGVRVTPRDIEGIDGGTAERALIEVATQIVNQGDLPRTATLITDLCDSEGRVLATERSPVTAVAGEVATVRQRMLLEGPHLWSPDAPVLYGCRSRLVAGDETLDTGDSAFGIRRLQLDAQNGLRLNGERVLLRGGCIHHDNGVVGAATFPYLEERRVAIMKAAGYNALRSAHHPMSRAMLDACDRLGMLVMDETFDVWQEPKTPHDYALNYAEWWERDVEAMVAKDYNHPSVILYSIGNEIPDIGTPRGAAVGRAQAEKIRALDGTRYVTNALNALIAVMGDLAEILPATAAGGDGRDVNAFMGDLPQVAGRLTNHPAVQARLEESAALLDIVGYNYARQRYQPETEAHPHRLLVGSETFVPDIDLNWALVKRMPNVLGDFCWTAWDYLGEVAGFFGAWPRYFSTSGTIDFTGHRKPASYHREIVWGLRREPYIAVQRPQTHGQPPPSSPWAWTDAIDSWTWPGFKGQPATVEVYADADEVELLLNGRSLGRQPAGEEHRFRAFFEATYERGVLEAVAYRGGAESGRTTLRTAGPGLVLDVACDRDTLRSTGDDVACVAITLTDGEGTVRTDADRMVRVTVEGAGSLQGFGSADPLSEEQFTATARTTFDGRALAVVRAGLVPGTITVRANAEGCEERVITIRVA